MAAANCENRSPGFPDEDAKVFNNPEMVIIKVAQRAAQHDRFGLELSRRFMQFRNMYYFDFRPDHQPLNVTDDILDRHAGYLPFTFQMRLCRGTPFAFGKIRQVAFIAQQVIDDEYANLRN